MSKQAYVADLNRCPPSIAPETSRTYTVGDLHGNTMKLIYFLVLHGAITLSGEQYNELYTLYEAINADDYVNPDASRERFERFAAILNEADFHNADHLFRLIGDTLADRGANDYLTLLVLQQMQESDIAYEINLSNHDLEYLAKAEGTSNPGTAAVLVQPDPTGSFTHSMHAMWTCVKQGILVKDEIERLHLAVVAPHLRLFSHDQTESRQLVIYAHAPVLIQAIFYAAKQLEIIPRRTLIKNLMRDATVEQLRRLIDSINVHVAKLAKAGRLTKQDQAADIHALGPLCRKLRLSALSELGPHHHAFGHAMWARKFSAEAYDLSETVCERLGIALVHGHIGSGSIQIIGCRETVSAGYINLDANPLGKDCCRIPGFETHRNREGALLVAQSQRVRFSPDYCHRAASAAAGGGGGGGGGAKKHSSSVEPSPYPAPGGAITEALVSPTASPQTTSTQKWGTAAITLGSVATAGGAVALGLALGSFAVAALSTGIGAGVVLATAAVCAIVWLVKHCREQAAKPRPAALPGGGVLRGGEEAHASAAATAAAT
jgi:hypothetical protein